jgi:hypothetical protein
MPTTAEQAKKAVEDADRAAAAVLNSSPSAMWDSKIVETLTWGVLGFATIVVVLMTILLYRKDANGQQTLKCFGLVLIITFSSILLIVGYSSEQLTPIVGLFGAIAGYLLGKDHAATATAPASKEPLKHSPPP